MPSAVFAIGLLLLFAVLRISRRFDARVDDDARDALPGLQFELDPDNPESRTMVRFLISMALLSTVVTVALFTVVSPLQAIAPAVVVCLLALVATWRFTRYFRGVVEVQPTGIVIRASARIVRLPWEHVRAIDVTTFRTTGGADANFAALMRAGIDQTFVRVKLNRSLRIDTLAGLAGPAVAGVPTGIRQCRIWLANPDDFVRLAQPHLPVLEPVLSTTSNAQPSSSV